MRVSSLFEGAKFPLGSKAPSNGFTFGFEAEFLAKGHYVEEVTEVTKLEDLLIGKSPDKIFSELQAYFNFDLPETIGLYYQEFGNKAVVEVFNRMGADNFVSYFFDTTPNTSWVKDDPRREKNVRYDDGFLTIYDMASVKSTYYTIADELSEYGVAAKILTGSSEDKDFDSHYWYLEEDGSVGDDNENSCGVELSSPVLKNIEEFNANFDLILDYIANSEGLYTNSSCGLHINVGIPFSKLDRVKFAVFAGEKYLKRTFSRFGGVADDEIPGANITSLLSNQVDFQKNFDHLIFQLNKKLKSLENDSEDRFMINFKPLDNGLGYVEIRAPGGANYEHRKEEIKQHVYRFLKLLYVAADPNAYRKEYIQKVYLLLSKKENTQENLVERRFRQWLEQNDIVEENLIKNITSNPIVLFDFLSTKEEYMVPFPPKNILRLLLKQMRIDSQEKFETVLNRPMGLYKSFGLSRVQDKDILETVSYIADTMGFAIPGFFRKYKGPFFD